MINHLESQYIVGRWRCPCVNVAFGSYANTIILGWYPVLDGYRKRRQDAGLDLRGVTMDRCIVDEIISLWNKGIITYGSCCGHNKGIPMVIVAEESIQSMRDIGYEKYIFNKACGGSEREDGFILKSLKEVQDA